MSIGLVNYDVAMRSLENNHNNGHGGGDCKCNCCKCCDSKNCESPNDWRYTKAVTNPIKTYFFDKPQQMITACCESKEECCHQASLKCAGLLCGLPMLAWNILGLACLISCGCMSCTADLTAELTKPCCPCNNKPADEKIPFAHPPADQKQAVAMYSHPERQINASVTQPPTTPSVNRL